MRNGQQDWGELTTCARRVKLQFEDENQVILSADPEVEFGDIIAAMDALRGDNDLFPNILLSAGVR